MAEFLTSGTSRTSESFHFQAAHNFWQMMSWRNTAEAVILPWFHIRDI